MLLACYEVMIVMSERLAVVVYDSKVSRMVCSVTAIIVLLCMFSTIVSFRGTLNHLIRGLRLGRKGRRRCVSASVRQFGALTAALIRVVALGYAQVA